MLKNLILGAAATASALVMLPSAAQAQYRGGYHGDRYDRGGYNDGYYRDGYRRYRPGDYYGRRSGYNNYGYGNYYGRGYNQYGYGDRSYRGRRCGSGTTGAIVGGAAGALVGREIGRNC